MVRKFLISWGNMNSLRVHNGCVFVHDILDAQFVLRGDALRVKNGVELRVHYGCVLVHDILREFLDAQHSLRADAPHVQDGVELA